MTASTASSDVPAPAIPVRGLWRHGEFVKLWSGQTVSLLGSLVARRIAARLGAGPTMSAGELVVGLGGLLIPLGMAAPALALPVLVTAEAIQSAASAIYSINRVSLAQAVTPDRMRGRAGASITVLGLAGAGSRTASACPLHPFGWPVGNCRRTGT